MFASVVAVLPAAGAHAGPNCQCRADDGRRVELGETACLRGQLARCEMFLNNTSWRFLGQSCPQSLNAPRLDKPLRALALWTRHLPWCARNEDG
jgi:hypothetical protein